MGVEQQLAYWKRRARDAERRIEAEQRHNANTTVWAHKAFDEQRRLAERCTFLYGAAMRRGADHNELEG